MIRRLSRAVITASLMEKLVTPFVVEDRYTLNETKVKQEITNALSLQGIILTHDDPHWLKCFIIKGDAMFECTKCDAKWSSSDAKIKVDLLHQEVSKQYKQRCKSCKSWATPLYSSGQLKNIVEAIINCVIKSRRQKQSAHQLDRPFISSVLRQVSHAVACYLQKSTFSLYEAMKDQHVTIDFYINNDMSFVHLLPNIEAVQSDCWIKTCEDKLEAFLKSLSKVSVPVAPAVLPKLHDVIQSTPSVYAEKLTVLQIGGEQRDVTDLLHSIKAVENSVRKPCILPY